jgi:hypothetical protein
VSDKLKTLLNIAGKVQQSGKLVTPQDVDRAPQQGATDKEIHGTVLIAAAFCMYNRYVDGLATPQPRERAAYRGMGERMAHEGYGHARQAAAQEVALESRGSKWRTLHLRKGCPAFADRWCSVRRPELLQVLLTGSHGLTPAEREMIAITFPRRTTVTTAKTAMAQPLDSILAVAIPTINSSRRSTGNTLQLRFPPR